MTVPKVVPVSSGNSDGNPLDWSSTRIGTQTLERSGQEGAATKGIGMPSGP